MKPKSKRKEEQMGLIKIISWAIFIGLCGASINYFASIILFLIWIGFSCILSNLSKENLQKSLLKDAKTFFPFSLLLLVYLKDRTRLYNPNIWFAFLFIIVISSTIFLKARLVDWSFIRKRFTVRSHILPYILLLSLIFLYIFIFTSISFLRHTRLFTGMDLAGFNQAMWNTIHGRILSSTIYGHNFLGCHFAPLLILISPIYALWQDPRMLLFLQSLFLGLGAIPVYLIANYVLKDKFVSLIFAFAWLSNPFLLRINLADFHEISLAPSLLLFSFYFLIKQKTKAYFIFILLSLMAKEDVSFLICALGIYAFFKQNRKIGIATFIIGLFWTFFAIKIAIPYIAKATSQTGETEWEAFYSQRYMHLGKNPSEWIKTILTHPLAVSKTLIVPQKIITTILLLLPFGFFPLLSPITLISLPNLLLHLLGYFKIQNLLLWHNSALVIPFLAISAIYGFGRLIERFKIKPATPLSFFLLSISFLSCLYFSEPPFLKGLSNDAEDYKPELKKRLLFIPEITREEKARFSLFYLLKSIVPKHAPIACGDPWAPHLSGRERIFRFNEARGNFEGADYVLSDYAWRFFSPELMAPHIKKLEESKQFHKIFEEERENGFVIWVRKGKEDELISSALRLKPNSSTYFILSSIYFHLGMFKEAQKEGEKAVKLSPDYPFKEAWLILGDIYFEKKDLDKAYLSYKRAAEIDSLCVFNLFKFGERAKGDIEKVIYKLKVKNDIFSKKQIAFIYANMGEYQEAISLLKEILAIEPNDHWTRDLLKSLGQ